MIRRGLLLLGLTLSGCGYATNGDEPSGQYQWHSLYREDVRTVAVPTFSNKDYTRGVEFALTKAVVQQLEAHSPYKVVDRDHADTILEGEITEVRRDNVSRDTETAVPQEELFDITVDLMWKDMRTGRVLMQRRNFEQTATYYPTLGEGEFFGNQQAVERLALGIVQEMQADW